MHFSIPEMKDVKDGSSSYVVFSIYINGVFHCDVRYSQLCTLNENLGKIHGIQNLPFFPPKRVFSLSKTQLEERRYRLEKYLQSISQNNEIANSSVLRRFLFLAQQKCTSTWHSESDLTVWLLNGTQILLKVSYEDSSENVLQKACEHLKIPQDLVHHFALFVQRQNENGDTQFIHSLQDYECPLITMNNLSGNNKIIIRKCYWDISTDLKLMFDSTTLNLLYAQTVSDIERGWIVANKDVAERLATLQSRGAKREYLDIARTLKFYGYLRFDNCTCDYPEPGTEVIVSIGQKDLVFTPKPDCTNETETKFRITRIRCWKITPLSEFNKEVQLSFEYLITSEKLQWITIIGEFAFLLSACLQAAVDELMQKKAGNFAQKNYIISLESSPSLQNLSNVGPSKSDNHIKELSSKNNGASRTHFLPLLQNYSFENIGDDDL